MQFFDISRNTSAAFFCADMNKLKRQKVANACERCKKRKRRCDGNEPCKTCVDANSICEFIRPISQEAVQRYEDEMAQLHSEIEKLRNENSFLKSYTLQQVAVTKEKRPPESLFIDVLSRLLYKTTTEDQEHIGPFAVITIVKTIKKLLLGNQEETESPTVVLDTTIDNTLQIPAPLEEAFLAKFFSLSHNRSYYIDEVWFKKVLQSPNRTHWEDFCYNMALGIGCRLEELLYVSIYPQPEVFFHRALTSLKDLTIQLTPLQQIQACLLIGCFVSRSYHLSFYISAWELTGCAMRKLVQYGYYKKQTLSLENAWNYEFIKRLFWSAYNADKLLSLSLGRPSANIDNFIDIPYPVSYEVSPNVGDWEDLYRLQILQQSNINMPITALTSFVATLQMRAIETRIHFFLYSSFACIPVADSYEALDDSLSTWYSSLPTFEAFEKALAGRESYSYLDLLYYRARLLLVLPMLIKNSGEMGLLDQACLAAGRICTSYKKLHRESILEFSVVALHTTFLAGITMAYYLRTQGEPNFTNIHHDLRACSSLLLVFSERWSEAKTYSDLVDRILQLHPQEALGLNTFNMNEDFWDQILQDIKNQ